MKIEGRVSTPNASHYLQQVCRHWAHRFTSTFNDERGKVDFGDGYAIDLIAHAAELELVIRCAPESADLVKNVIEESILCFADKEGMLAFRWSDRLFPQ